VRVAADPSRRVAFPGLGEFERPLEVTAEVTGWDAPTARAYQYRAGQTITGAAEGDEMVMWLVAGAVAVSATGVARVALYLPPGGEYTAEVFEDALVLYCRAPGPVAPGRSATLGAVVDASVSERLRVGERRVPAGAWGSLPLAPRSVVYHRFSSPEGFALVADPDGGAYAVRDGDAVVASRHYAPAVAPGASLLAITVTAV
jgi:5-deoxy-D-glucuronate isomerase